MFKIKNIKISKITLFGICSFLFLFDATTFFAFGQMFNIMLILNVLITIIFILYTTLIIFFKSKTKNKIIKNLISKNLIFYLFLLLFISQMFILNFLEFHILVQIFDLFFHFISALFLGFLVLFIFLGAMLFKQFNTKKYNKKFRRNLKIIIIVLFLISIILFSFYTLSGIKKFVFSDEQFLSFLFFKQLILNHNPYANSIINANSLQYVLYSNFSNFNISMPTFNTNNKIITNMPYPSMYFLTSIPFYFISKINLKNIFSFDAKIEYLVFDFLLFFIIAFLLDKKQLKKPMFIIILILGASIFAVATPIDILLISLLLIAYFKINNKYIWIVLGLILSMQELMFLPVLFLIIYSFNNQGIKRGFYNFVGAISVFAILNLYFLVKNANAFINSVFLAINSYLIPNSLAPFGFFILNYIAIPLSYFKYLFILSSIILILIFIYLNKKELIALFSLIPLLFLQRSIIPYFSIFILFLIIILYLENKTNEKQKQIKLTLNLFYILLSILIISFIIILIFGHYQYLKYYNIYVKQVSFNINNITNTTNYKLLIIYKNTSLNYVNIFINIHKNNNIDTIGLYNEHILVNESYNAINKLKLQNLVNNNFVLLNKTKNNSEISISINGTYNVMRCTLYNNQFYYNCPIIFSK